MSRYDRPRLMREEEANDWRALNLFGSEVGERSPHRMTREDLAVLIARRDAYRADVAQRLPPCLACDRERPFTATREGLCITCYHRHPDRRDPDAPVHHEYRQGRYPGAWAERLRNEPVALTIGEPSKK